MSRKCEGFQVASGFGLSLDVQNQTLSYFSGKDHTNLQYWPCIGTDNKIVLDLFPLKNENDLLRFMMFLKKMFDTNKLSIKAVKVQNSNIFACYFEQTN